MNGQRGSNVPVTPDTCSYTQSENNPPGCPLRVEIPTRELKLVNMAATFKFTQPANHSLTNSTLFARLWYRPYIFEQHSNVSFFLCPFERQIRFRDKWDSTGNSQTPAREAYRNVNRLCEFINFMTGLVIFSTHNIIQLNFYDGLFYFLSYA